MLQYNVSCSFSAHIKEVQQMECENGGSCWTSVWLASFVQIPQKRISRYPSRLHTFHEYWFTEKRGMLENISAVLIFYNKILFTYIWCFSCVRILRGEHVWHSVWIYSPLPLFTVLCSVLFHLIQYKQNQTANSHRIQNVWGKNISHDFELMSLGRSWILFESKYCECKTLIKHYSYTFCALLYS